VVDNGSHDDSLYHLKLWAEGRLNVWISPNNPLRYLSHPPVKKPLPYVLHSRDDAVKGGIKVSEKNASDDLSEGRTDRLVFIDSGENLGFAGGNNIGIKYALTKGDFQYIWLLNNDTVIGKDALKKIIEKAESVENIGVTGSKIYDYYSTKKVQTIGGIINQYFGMSKQILNESELKKMNYIGGASFLISKLCIERVGLLPEEYFLYCEETDYCMRINNQGLKLSASLDSIVYHKEGISSNNTLKDYYAVRNPLYFSRRHFKKYFLTTWIYFLYRSVLPKIVRFQFKRLRTVFKAVSDFFNGRMGKMV
jgi:GT2 family glycosyltransferase